MSKTTVTVTRLSLGDSFARFEETAALAWIQFTNVRGENLNVTAAQMKSHVALLEGSGWSKTVRRD